MNCQAVRTLREVARIMTARGEPMSHHDVFNAERRALAKLRADPELRCLAALADDDRSRVDSTEWQRLASLIEEAR